MPLLKQAQPGLHVVGLAACEPESPAWVAEQGDWKPEGVVRRGRSGQPTASALVVATRGNRDLPTCSFKAALPCAVGFLPSGSPAPPPAL